MTKKNKKKQTRATIIPKRTEDYGKEVYRKIILYGWVFLLCILPYLRGKTLVGGASKYFVSFTVIITLFTITLHGINKGKLSWPRQGWEKALLLYFFVLIITTIASIDPRVSLFGMYPNFHTGIIAKILVIIMFYLILISQPTKEEIKGFLKIFTIIGIFIGIHAIFERHGWLHIGNPFVAESGRAIGMLQNSDFTLSYLLFIMPLTIYYYLEEKQRLIKIFFAISILILLYDFFILSPGNLQSIFIDLLGGRMGVFIVLCLSIASFFLYIMKGQIYTFIYNSGYKKTIILVLVLLIAVSAILYSPLKKPVTYFLTGTANSMRWWAWSAGVENGKEHFLLGSGAGTISYFLPQYQLKHSLKVWDYHVTTSNLHNETVDYFATMGVVGLLSYLLIWGLIFYYTVRGIKKNNSEKKLLVALLGSMILFFGFNQVLFSTTGTMFLPWLAFAIILILTGRVSYLHKVVWKPSINIIISTLLIIMSSFLLYWSTRYWLAEYFHGKATENLNDYNYFRKAAVLFPYNDQYLLSYGYFNYFDNIIIKQNILGQKFSQQEENKILLNSTNNLKKAVEMRPRASVNWVNYGVVLLAFNDGARIQEANRSFSKATALNPADPLTVIQIAEGYENVGDFNMAKKYLDRSVRLKDDFTTLDVYVAYCKFYLRQNDVKNAFLMFHKARRAGLSYDSEDGKNYLKFFRENKKLTK